MILRRNTEPKNKDFFSRVAPIIPYVASAGIIFQIISAITEAFGIYQFGEALNSPFFVNAFFTIIVVLGWELLIRTSVQYLSKTSALSLRKEIQLEKLEAVLFILAILLGGPLIYYSYSVSKENAHMTFEFMMPDKDTTTVSNIVETKKIDLGTINSDYQSRRSELEKRFSDLESAATGVYESEKNAINKTIGDYRAKERNTGRKYTSRINRQIEKVNDSYKRYQLEIKNITDAKNIELASLSEWREKRENGALSFANNELKEDNDKRSIFVAWFKKYSYIWSHFAGLSAILAVLCVVFVVVFNVLAGIEEETHLTPENLEPGLLSEIMYLAQIKITSPIRNRVRTEINKTASKRVTLEIVTPSTVSVTPTRYTPPHVTSEAVTVTRPLRTESVTPLRSVTESVTEKRYGKPVTEAQHELPTHVTPVTPPSVTDHGTSAAPKLEPVTPPEAIVVELSPTVTGSKPEKVKSVTDQGPKVVMVGPTKAVITGSKGEKETVTLQQVSSRKRANLGNIKKRTTQNGKDNAERLYDFYYGLELKMKEAKK
jgi:hypothetical protein